MKKEKIKKIKIGGKQNGERREKYIPPELFYSVESVDLAQRGSPSSALFRFGLIVAPKRPFSLQLVLQPCLRRRRRRNHFFACCHFSLSLSLSNAKRSEVRLLGLCVCLHRPNPKSKYICIWLLLKNYIDE